METEGSERAAAERTSVAKQTEWREADSEPECTAITTKKYYKMETLPKPISLQ